MPDILHEVIINSSPESIYKALTETSGIQGWWTEDAKSDAREGGKTEVKFYGGQVHFVFSVAALKPGSRVYWSVDSAVPGWENTRVTWDLSEGENGTKVLFGHRDWVSTDGSFATSSYNWAWYLTSLKDYVETGEGRPFKIE
ncbi:MAG TPA: SRPBCC domain-containing protein [Aggregatilineales bacterium]|nr:SRPBCC domain-containing protein [Aggregatilineales bacterium]